MKILIIGQCTLHWGRMEFGNIGNFYILEPFVRLLHETFPEAILKTTFQLSDRFCKDENIEVLPMDLYYSWENDLQKAEYELQLAFNFLETGQLIKSTAYIDEIVDTDLVIDFSGDIWGDNADFLGKDRFYVGLCKDRVAQIFAKKTVMLAGSPGPFLQTKYLDFAKGVYANFDLVTNRESISKELLLKSGFDVSRTYDLVCPAFRFEPGNINEIASDEILQMINSSKPKVGFLICGWNFTKGPFDMWPRLDNDYLVFAEAIEQFQKEVDTDIYLLSHSNGFPIPPQEFELIHGRDYPVMKQLQSILKNRGNSKNIYLVDGIYNAWETKAILGQFDMVVSGRIHAAVAALSQCVPTVIIDYGHEPKAHKLKGFAEVAGAKDYVAEPDIKMDLYLKMKKCWLEKEHYRKSLNLNIPKVKEMAKMNFEILKPLFK